MGAYLSLLMLVVLAGLLVWALGVLAVFWSFTHPPRLTDLKALRLLGRCSPADFNLPFQTLYFDTAEEGGRPGPRLAAWFIPPPIPSPNLPPADAGGAGLTVLIYPGYGDAKVGALAWVVPLHAAGAGCLVLDPRAHGDSEGEVCTFGQKETQDLRGVIEQWCAYVHQNEPGKKQTLVLMGLSLGSAVVLNAARRRSGGQPVVSGLIFDSPYWVFSQATRAFSKHLRMPGGLLLAPAHWLLEKRYGISARDPSRALAEIRLPVWAALPGDDPFVLAEERDRFIEAVKQTNERSAAGVYGGSTHLHAIVDHPEEYVKDLLGFIANLKQEISRDQN